MTLEKSLRKEEIFKGNSRFTILSQCKIKGRDYINIRARVKHTKLMDFELPRDAFPFLEQGKDFNDYFGIGHGYEIVVKNKAVQRIYIDRELIYDRLEHGF